MIGFCSSKLHINPNVNEILPPQNTILVDEFQNNYAFDPITGIGTALSNFTTLTNKIFKFQLQNQNNETILLSFDDKNISNGIYANIDGYDYNLDLRFLNLSSPNLIFLPLIKAKDININIDLNLTPVPNSINYTGTITDYVNKLSNNQIAIHDLILLTTQTNTAENCLYRVTEVSNNNLSILQDNKLNSVLNSDQQKIFIRACVLDSNGETYFGLNNLINYRWIQQTNFLKLPDCNYNLIRDSEIINLTIDLKELSSAYVLEIGQNIAISIKDAGYTSGIYKIRSFNEENVFLEPIYPDKLFIHQFVKIANDFSTNQPCIWAVNYDGFNKEEFYGYQKFNFYYYDINDIVSTPLYWAKQVGGANDKIVGLTLYNTPVTGKFLSTSDEFKVGIGLPSWMSNNSTLYGLQIKANYRCEGFV